MAARKELVVSALENGTVIDHIPSDAVFRVVKILGLDRLENQMTLGVNLDSQRMGHKGIIKIANKYFASEEVNRIALVAPNAKLNIVRDYSVVEKVEVHLPESIRGIVRCMNPKCITNHDAVLTRFYVEQEAPLALRCHYCEKLTMGNQMEYILD